jgi:sterol 3beta-glucosyltransferase
MTTKPKQDLKRIWIAALGSRGDVQPYAAVGAALVRHGYEVTFLTHGFDDFLALAEGYGMRAVALSKDPNFKNYPNLMKGLFESNNRLIFEGLAQMNKDMAPFYCQAFLSEFETHGLPDLCLGMHQSMYILYYLAIHHKVPFMELSTYFAAYSPKRSTLGFPQLPFGLGYYLIHYLLPWIPYNAQRVYDGMVDKPILHNYTGAKMVANNVSRKWPLVVLKSPELAQVMVPAIMIKEEESAPPPFLNMVSFVGPAVFESQQQLTNATAFGNSTEQDRICSFIEKEGAPKPIYIGWGSMMCKSPEYMVELCAKAIYYSQQRAILLGGDLANVTSETLELVQDLLGDDILEYARKNLLVVRRVPHEWLFPRVAAIVHHGGAGTTAASMRAGVPVIVTPMMVDQFDFSYAVDALGVGIGFEKALPKISAQELGEAIETVIADLEMTKKAATLGRKMRSQNGAEAAVGEVEKFWNGFCITGRFERIFPGEPPKTYSRLKKAASLVGIVAMLGTITAILVRKRT